ncbi:MAG: hypothetical protein ACRDI1_08500 [Actinomycetota bacterium]
MIARLQEDTASRAFSGLVRFPLGWERPGPGYYEADEEFVVVDGVLEMSGRTYTAGDWVFVPAGSLRERTAARPALALVRFFGPARWVPSEVGAGGEAISRRVEDSRGSVDSPFGAGRAVLLRRSETSSSWVVDPPPAGTPSPFEAELLDAEGRSWVWVARGAALPGFFGRCFCRTFLPAAG